MLKLALRFAINAVAIWAAAELIDGVSLTTEPLGFALVILVFGLVNAVLKPVVVIIGFPFIVLTLGLFTLVINAGLFGLTAWLTEALVIAGFWPAFWGAFVVSVTSWLLGAILGTNRSTRDSEG